MFTFEDRLGVILRSFWGIIDTFRGKKIFFERNGFGCGDEFSSFSEELGSILDMFFDQKCF